MENIKINNNINIKPKLDELGRNKGKEIWIDENKVAEERIVYRKVGDHATNMPASIYYADVNYSPCIVRSCLKYAYDKKSPSDLEINCLDFFLNEIVLIIKQTPGAILGFEWMN